MRKALFRILIIAAASLSIAGCKVEEISLGHVQERVNKSFTAVFEPETRASIEMSGTTGKVKWEAGDAISILDGVSNIRVELTAENITDGGAKAVFNAEVAVSENYFAVYPYSPDNRIEKGEAVTVRPSSRQDGTFGSNYISVGKFTANSSTFTFSSAVGVLKFTQTSDTVAKIVFAAKTDKKLFDNVAAVEVTTGTPGTYYFCLPAFSLSDGFVITAYNAAGKAKGLAYSNNAISLTAGNGLNLGSLDSKYKPVLTVAEFKALGKKNTKSYIVSGTITDVEDTVYGNFDIEDETGTLYIYGVLTPAGVAQKQFQAAGLKVGDYITLYGARNSYNGEIEMKKATYINHKPASFDYLLGQSEYGAYSEFQSSSYFSFTQYQDQIAVSNGTFRFVNPNTSKWFSVTGLPTTVSEGSEYSVTIQQNYSKAIPSSASKTVKVGKVEDDSMTGTSSVKKVWLYNSDGIGYIIRMLFDETK